MGDPMLVADAVQDGGQPLAANTSRFWLVALFCNVPLLSAFFGFSLAQIAKFLLHFANHGRWDVTRLWGSGGMPSSHTAFVTGLSMSGEPDVPGITESSRWAWQIGRSMQWAARHASCMLTAVLFRYFSHGVMCRPMFAYQLEISDAHKHVCVRRCNVCVIDPMRHGSMPPH